jgi:hypothetical protein
LFPIVPPVFDLFECQALQFGRIGSRREWQRRTECLAWQVGDELLFPTNAVDRVIAELGRLGWRIVIDDRRHRPSIDGLVDTNFSAGLTSRGRELADIVQSKIHGLIESESHAEKCEQIGFICRLFRVRVLVAVPTRSDCGDYEMVVARHVGANVAWADNLGCDTSCRVGVCTYRQFQTSNPLDWQIVLLPDPRSAVAKQPRQVLESMQSHRIYGVTLADRSWSRRETLLAEAFVGPTIFSAAGLSGPVVDVHFVEPRLAVGRAARLSELERKRAKIWGNDEPNRLVADIVDGLANGCWAVLEALGVDPAIGRRIDHSPAPLRSVVVVESVEHARELHRILTTWPIVSDSVADAAADRDQPVAPGAIVTTAALNRRRLQATDVIVRADGGMGMLDVASIMPCASIVTPPRVLLIDFADAFDSQAAEDTRRRVVDYEQLQYRVTGPAWIRAATDGHGVHAVRPHRRAHRRT